MITEEQIQAYVFGELDAETAKVVADALARDEDLQSIAARYQRMYEGLRAMRIQDLEEDIAAFEATLPPPQPVPKPKPGKSNTGRWFFFLLITIGVIFAVVFSSTPSDQQLAREYFQLPLDPRTAGSTNSNGQTYQKALETFFDDQDYTNSQPAFAALSQDSIYGSSAQFFLPHADFLAEAYNLALTHFQALDPADYPPGRQPYIAWNTLMTRLARGETIQIDPAEWPDNFRAEELRKALD